MATSQLSFAATASTQLHRFTRRATPPAWGGKSRSPLAHRVRCSAGDVPQGRHEPSAGGRRAVVLTAAALSLSLVPAGDAAAVGPQTSQLGFKKDFTSRYKDIPEEDFTDLGNGLKYYVVKQGTGGGKAKPGDRVAVHYDVKRKDGRLTIATSRQGAGVTGGVPYGFDVGGFGRPGGAFIKGLDLGTNGMVVGELRRLIVPPELAYGNRQVQEIPPNATLKVDVELLSIKKDTPFG